MRAIFAAFTCYAALFSVGMAHAETSYMVGDNRIQIKVAVTANLVADDTAYTQGKAGFYVFVASARPDGLIEVEALENVATCTRVRPRFGRTLPTASGFKLTAYAAYFGPYNTGREASDVRSAIMPCVSDAYVGVGVMQRF